MKVKEGTTYPDKVNELANRQADVLSTHVKPGYHKHGFEMLDPLALTVGAKLLVHGRRHNRLDSSPQRATQGLRSFGVGVRGITAIDDAGDATVVVPRVLDASPFKSRCIEDARTEATGGTHDD